MENLFLNYKLPENFNISMNYMYNNSLISDSLSSINHLGGARLENQLYLSLHTYAYYRYFNSSHLFSDEKRNAAGIGLNYNKIIPFGKLYIDYEFRLDKNAMDLSRIISKITNEELLIEDTRLALLRYPKVDPQTIEIRDKISSMIYKNGLDYQVFERNGYIEIRRIPGGLLMNNTTVLINYSCQNPESYSYHLLAHNFFGKISLFDRLFEVYSRLIINDYQNVIISDNNILNRINQKVFGLQSYYKEISAGAELDFYQSNIMPYRHWRVFAGYSGKIFYNLLFLLMADYKNFFYSQISEINRFLDFNSKMVYQINSKSRISLDLNYFTQNARNITSGYFSAKTEYIIKFTQLYFILGFEIFNRFVDTQKSDYKNIYLKIESRF